MDKSHREIADALADACIAHAATWEHISERFDPGRCGGCAGVRDAIEKALDEANKKGQDFADDCYQYDSYRTE